MVKKFLKKQSKRMPAKKKYKIARKVRQHNKKMKKEAKKNKSKKRLRKDPGVPNKAPFKNEILKEAEERKKRAEEIKQKQKDDRHNLLMEKRGLEKMKNEAEAKNEEFVKENDGKKYETNASTKKDSSVKAYYKEFKKVVEAADVVLQILDARDPLGSRCPQVEETVLSSGTNKKLVLVINKIDLIPKENLSKWLKYLRNEFPAIAFKSSTQTQKKNLARNNVSVASSTDSLAKSNQCLGANILMKLLGNYCRNADIRTHIRVGVVGFPNVGKSSVINSLKRSRVCSVGSTPGITKSLQEIHLDKHIVLLDSPGIVFAKADDVSSALRNAIKVDSIEDPIPAVEQILKRINQKDLMSQYKIPQFSSTAEFLSVLAKKQGRLKKGGVPNVDQAARVLLNNWNEGKIKYYTHPPEEHKLPAYLTARIVSEMSAPFDLDSLTQQEESETVKKLQPLSTKNLFCAETTGPVEASDQPFEETVKMLEEGGKEEENDIENEDEKKGNDDDDVPKKMKAKAKKLDSALQLDGNLKLNQMSKAQFKRMKKQRKKNEKLATSLSATLAQALTLSDGNDYDFCTDFKE